MSKLPSERVRFFLALHRKIYPLGDTPSSGASARSELYQYLRNHSATLIHDERLQSIIDDDDRRQAEIVIKACRDEGVQIFLGQNLESPYFQIIDPPPIFFVRGKLPDPAENPYIAFVGARKATRYGREMTERFINDLKPYHPTIVSGLAYGIDYEAHVAALKHGCPTIAILGCGIDDPYPRGHLSLRDEIIKKGGAVISEFPWGTPPLHYNFPLRNRLISGLSRGVVVIEARIRSGSLITARWAGEGGREVFALPGSVGLAMSEGTNHLIKEGAHLTERGEEIADILGLKKAVVKGTLEKNSGHGPSDDDIKRSILRFMRSGGNDWGFLAKETGLTIQELLQRKTEIELGI